MDNLELYYNFLSDDFYSRYSPYLNSKPEVLKSIILQLQSSDSTNIAELKNNLVKECFGHHPYRITDIYGCSTAIYIIHSNLTLENCIKLLVDEYGKCLEFNRLKTSYPDLFEQIADET